MTAAPQRFMLKSKKHKVCWNFKDLICTTHVFSKLNYPSSGNMVAKDDVFVVDFERDIVLDLLANDVAALGSIRPSSVAITTDQNLIRGQVSLSKQTGKVIYSPEKQYHGTDSFMYSGNSLSEGRPTQFLGSLSLILLSVNTVCNDMEVEECGSAIVTIRVLPSTQVLFSSSK